MKAVVVAGACLAALAAAQGAQAAQPTGRYLVSFQRTAPAAGSAAASRALLARAGVRRAGPGVPALRLATVRGTRAQLARLRRDPAVRSVSVEWRRDLRRVPGDPALSLPETAPGTPAGVPVQWALARQNFPAAWFVTTGLGALVGAVDTGVDAAAPDLAGKIATVDAVNTASPSTDPDGHGTHTAGLACAATDNGAGIAGAGWGCRLAVVKVPEAPVTGGIADQDIIDGIRVAVDRGAQAVNMSFGGGDSSPALSQTIDYAVSKGVVLVASASNDPVADQGAPARDLQPGDAADLTAGRGLVVTAADFGDHRAGTGFGGQVSLAAYGFFTRGGGGPPGLVSTYRGVQPGELPVADCGCRRAFGTDDHYAYLAGTSMAAPQVSALAAMVAALNPYLSLRDKLTLLKRNARGRGSWNPELGWGIIDAGSTVQAARRVDRLAPVSRVRARRAARARRGARRAVLRLRWSSSDPRGRAELIASGVRSHDVYMKRGRGRYRRIRRAARLKTMKARIRPGVYRFYSRARDRQGNLERTPRRADVRVVVRRARR